MTLFDRALSVPAGEIQILLHGPVPVLCSDFKLNRRRIRGSDFLMRWSLGVWSKERLVARVTKRAAISHCLMGRAALRRTKISGRSSYFLRGSRIPRRPA